MIHKDGYENSHTNRIIYHIIEVTVTPLVGKIKVKEGGDSFSRAPVGRMASGPALLLAVCLAKFVAGETVYVSRARDFANPG